MSDDWPPLEVDVNEPDYMVRTLSQTLQIERKALNAHGEADYAWLRYDGDKAQVERKTWGELTTNINNVERQLFNYLQRDSTHVILALEGIAVPCPAGTRTYKLTSHKSKAFVVEQSVRSAGIQLYYAWLHQVSRYCEIQYSADLTTTAYLISALYKADQKPEEEHRTFRRHLKQVTWHPNPQVKMLMNLAHGLGIGEELGERTILAFGTVWNVLTSTPDQLSMVDGLGKATARKLLRQVGRPDV